MTNPQDTEVEKIAAGLTKAQREAMTRWADRDHRHAWAYKPTMVVLERLGLTENRVDGSGWAMFTDLGLRVRTYLNTKREDVDYMGLGGAEWIGGAA